MVEMDVREYLEEGQSCKPESCRGRVEERDPRRSQTGRVREHRE